MRFTSRRLLLLFLVPTFFKIEAQQPAPRSPMVVVISLDAFAAESLQDPTLPAPTLHALMHSGAYARSMQPINPTVTWPNHTTLVTGVNASRHHVLVNGLIVNQRTDSAPHVKANAPKSQLVAVPTVYDAVHAAGMTTAEVDWVAIHQPGTIDWSFAEKPNPDSPIVQDLLHDGSLKQSELDNFSKPSQAWRDRIYTLAAMDILRRHHPNLTLVHLLALDGIEHQTGFGNDSGRNTIAFLDDRVKDIVDTVRDAGDLDRTTFLIVSDHGQESVHHMIHPNVLLREQGLQSSAAANPAGETLCLPDGGFALLFQQHATPKSVAALKSLFSAKPGIRAALTPQEAAADGWPTPSQTTQAPDLLLYANDDFAFADGNTGAYITDTHEVGQHGYPNTQPLMQAIFIASGNGIKPAGEIPSFPNLDVAPTIAHLLGVKLESIDGHPLASILK
ncbi:alkaline phosphatase family protein [Granulicella sp. dw_53]|uniref:alkaline phosphatase family protein n=1 Tax=Granulicella sp. dw_53 TaxID=2719792 RepID=UPI001BD405C2|nr:alkaline phosphatase family protein [Granulicella sp. dw_53]